MCSLRENDLEMDEYSLRKAITPWRCPQCGHIHYEEHLGKYRQRLCPHCSWGSVGSFGYIIGGTAATKTASKQWYF